MHVRSLFRNSAAGLGLLISGSGALAQDYERLDGALLKKLIESDSVHKQESLNAHQAALLPTVIRGLRTPVLIVQTDQGNLARLQVSHALRQPTDPAASPLPIVILERFETFEPGSDGKRTAQERQRVLFPGFQVDLDSGQIVPPGCGGDLTLEVSDPAHPALVPTPGARLYSLVANPFKGEKPATRPSAARQIQPTDFSGAYRLVANGQWTGDLDLEVDDQGHARGRYRSDQTGAVYQVRGQTSKAPSNQIELSVQFPRSELTLAGWLWTEGKTAFAGSAKLDDRPFGFVAIRQGAVLVAPEHLVAGDADHATPDLLLEVDHEGVVHRDGQVLSPAGLPAILASIRERVETPVVRFQVDPNCPFSILNKLLSGLEELGPVDIRLGRLAPKPAAP